MTNKPIYVKGEGTFLEAAHDLSVSGQPTDEAAGRCFKAMMPSLVQWLNAEAARGTPDEEVLAVVPALVTSLAFTTVLNKFTDKQAVATMSDVLKSQVDTLWWKSRKQAL
jgi:hypothetical protein